VARWPPVSGASCADAARSAPPAEVDSLRGGFPEFWAVCSEVGRLGPPQTERAREDPSIAEINGRFTRLIYASLMSAAELVRQGDISGEIKDPRLLQLYWYWQERKGARRHPSRRDIDPLEFRYILGHVMMIDVLDSVPRLRVRLHGTEMVQRARYDLTGKFLEDLPNPEYRTYVLKRCKAMVQEGEPAIVRHDRVLDGEVRKYEALWLPFSEDDKQVTMLLCALIYDRQH
jgi:hypothetical protein